jgi:hypothetical protein
MSDILLNYWTVIVSIAGAIIWFVRLEAKVLANEKAICDREKASELNARMIEGTRAQQSELMQRMARIESKLDLIIEQINK